MEGIAESVKNGCSDAELRDAISKAGRRNAYREACRAFARNGVTTGDVETARDIVAMGRASPKKWCTAATLGAVRKAVSGDRVVEIKFDADTVVLSSEVMAAPSENAASALASMIKGGDVCGAITHCRALEACGAGEIGWESALKAASRGRRYLYIQYIREMYDACGKDAAARSMLLDAAVAVAGGELGLKRPSAEEAQSVLRNAALFSAVDRPPALPKRRQPPAPESKVLRVSGSERSSPPADPIRVLKR